MGNEVNLLEPEVLGPQADGAASFNEYIGGAFPTFFSLIVLLAVIIIAWSGLSYMLSETPLGKKGAKERIWLAIGGLVIALAGILLLDTINPDIATTNPFDNLP